MQVKKKLESGQGLSVRTVVGSTEGEGRQPGDHRGRGRSRPEEDLHCSW